MLHSDIFSGEIASMCAWPLSDTVIDEPVQCCKKGNHDSSSGDTQIFADAVLDIVAGMYMIS